MFKYTQKSILFMNTSNITNYKPKDFASLLGVSVKTLQRWDRDGILKAKPDADIQLYNHSLFFLLPITSGLLSSYFLDVRLQFLQNNVSRFHLHRNTNNRCFPDKGQLLYNSVPEMQ